MTDIICTMPKFPIHSLQVKSFGPIAKANLEFSPQLNVIIGDNATGKSQLLKLLYTVTNVISYTEETEKKINENFLERYVADKLKGVFRPNELGRLITRGQGRARGEVRAKFSKIQDPLEFGFASNSKTKVEIKNIPGKPLEDTPVFLPSRELISIYPSFVSLYDNYHLEFDETWRDTAILLGLPALKGRKERSAQNILKDLSEILDGNIVEDGGHFQLKRTGGNYEAHLMSEGERKLAMIVRLVNSGKLLEGGYLFWDEPEANLNPRSQRSVAKTVAELAKQGSQVFVATHSLFMLREFQMLQEEHPEQEMRFIGLEKNPEGPGMVGGSFKEMADVPVIAALEAESEQDSRFLLGAKPETLGVYNDF